MAIKCHSGFQHYHMFHSNHCHGGGNNYGSIFNITNNCGGNCGGGFWGGLGAGLGYGLGGMFSGLFGGLMGGFGNMFGGFGFGNMFGGFGLGMGGWGFGGGLSWPWGGGNSERAGRADRDYDRYSSRRAEKDDKNYTPINEFDARGNEILSKEKSETLDGDIDKLIKELETYRDKEVNDNVNDGANKTQINQLIERLKAHKTATTPTPDPAGEEATGKIGETKISDLTADGVAGITTDAYDKLNDADKNALKAKVAELAKSNPDKAKDWAKSTTLPEELIIAARQSFYETGYENVKIDDLTDEALKNLVAVIDTSNIRDFAVKEVTEIKRDDSGKIKSFKMTATTGTQVTYHEVRVEHEELIFHGKQDSQEYAVQKGSDNNYRLMQYPYHKGHGSADVTSRQS